MATFFIMLAAAFNVCEETSVDINDIYTMSDKDAKVRDVVVNGKTYKVENGDIYRMSDTLMEYVTKEYTDADIQALNDNIKIENGKMTFGKLSTQTMTEKFRKVATNLVKDRCIFGDVTNNDIKIYKNMTSEQINNLQEVLKKANYNNWSEQMKANYKTKKYYCIFPSVYYSYGTYQDGISIALSDTPFVLSPYNNYGGFLQICDSKLNDLTIYTISGTPIKQVLTKSMYENNKSKLGHNVMARNGVTFISNGMAVLPMDKYIMLDNARYTSEDWEFMIDNMVQTYAYPYSINSMKAVTINKEYATDTVAYDYDTIDMKDLGTNIDSVVGKINGLVEQDKAEGLTTLHDQSALRELVNGVLGNTTTKEGEGTTITNDYINRQIDRVIEKMNEQIGTIKGIDTLTKEDLKGVLEGLKDGTLTKEDLRELSNEKEKELENENVESLNNLDLKVNAGIINKFPFCVPFDLVHIFKKLQAEKIEPKFEIPFVIPSINVNEKFVIDMTKWEPLIKVARWFFMFDFIVFLILVTRKLIKG